MASEAYTGRPPGIRRPGSLGTGLIILLGLAAAWLWSVLYLGLDVRQLLPGKGGATLAGEFFQGALNPALEFEGDYSGDRALGVPLQALRAAGMTVVFAAAAISLSVVGGLILGFLGSSAWWDRGGRRGMGPYLTAASRLTMTLMRSVHELIWAVLFLAALGSGHLVAVVAIAIPYTGTLAKVFSEMIDEADRGAYHALESGGAGTWQGYLCGLLPEALPDMLGYVFYRFECALRSSAVLGFFGFPTLGYYISASFENLHFREVWTYLYMLFALILIMDWWSGRIRKELRS